MHDSGEAGKDKRKTGRRVREETLHPPEDILKGPNNKEGKQDRRSPLAAAVAYSGGREESGFTVTPIITVFS